MPHHLSADGRANKPNPVFHQHTASAHVGCSLDGQQIRVIDNYNLLLITNGSATVDADDLPGDVGCRRHAQQRHDGRHLRRLAGPTHRDPRQLLLQCPRRHRTCMCVYTRVNLLVSGRILQVLFFDELLAPRWNQYFFDHVGHDHTRRHAVHTDLVPGTLGSWFSPPARMQKEV